jgi:hypothetical protein
MPPLLCRDDTHKVNWNGFPVEIPGTVYLCQHARISCVALKSHEDSLSCMDVLGGIDAGIRASFVGSALVVKNFLNDRAWSFLYSNRDYIDMNQGPASLGSSTPVMIEESHPGCSDVPVVRSQPQPDHPILPAGTVHNTSHVQGTCWAHVSRAVRKKETLMNQPETFPEFMHGLREIHDISNKGIAQVLPHPGCFMMSSMS